MTSNCSRRESERLAMQSSAGSLEAAKVLTHRQLARPAERVPPPRRAPVPDRSGRYLSCGHRHAANARNPRASARAAKGTAVTRTRRLAGLEATHVHVNSRHVEATAGRLQAALVPVELHIVFVPRNRVGAAAPVVAAVEPQGISKENQARAVYSQPCRASPLVRLHKARLVPSAGVTAQWSARMNAQKGRTRPETVRPLSEVRAPRAFEQQLCPSRENYPGRDSFGSPPDVLRSETHGIPLVTTSTGFFNRAGAPQLPRAPFFPSFCPGSNVNTGVAEN